jgi:SAM-dependent methyltransferase
VLNPTGRFSSRVENYVKYRPGYPPEIIPLLESECGLTTATVIADIGSGTGFLTRLFLAHGNRVFGVEPNAEMRAAGEHALASYPTFVSVAGAAEATTLPHSAIDLVIAGQAFHWFDGPGTRIEFERILRPAGWVVLVWNVFEMESPFMQGYHQILLRYGTDYKQVSSELNPSKVESFFAPNLIRTAHFRYQQVFDFDGLKGRVMSASYAPDQNHPEFARMMEELRLLFERNQRHGTIDFDYQTEVYYGKLG